MAQSPAADIAFITEPVREGLERVNQHLAGVAGAARIPADTAMLQHAVVSGGKKLRPTLTLLAGSFHPGHEDALVTMGAAVELLHIATLIHDDTVDKADTRRGRATVGNLWGPDVAVLVGDYVFATSATFVCDTGNIRVVRRFSETIMELAQGELAERFAAHNWEQTIDDYNARIYDKTATLFCTAAESGGVLSHAPEDETQALYQYGYNLGMAFQVMDDVLDLAGTEEELGKPVGNDLLQGTLTLPVLRFAERYPHEPALVKVREGSREPQDLAALVAVVRESDAIAEAFAVMEGYRDQALAALRRLPATRERASLEALVAYATDRRV